MKNILLYVILAFLIACTGEPSEEEQEITYAPPTDVASLFSSIDHFDTGRIARIELNTLIKCTGKIEIPPTDIFSIHPRIGGYVQSIRFLEGDKVNRGAVLASIEDPGFIARQRELLELKSQLDLASQDYERQKRLAEEGATTSKLYQSAEATWNQLNVSFNGLINELEMIGFSTSDLLENGTYQRSIQLIAPTDAIVNRVLANTGQYVEPHDIIYQLTGLDHIHLELNVLERDLPMISIGDRVQFNIAGYDQTFQAEIVKIGAEVDQQSGTLMVHCHISDEHHPAAFRPGIFASAMIMSKSTEAFALPIRGALKRGGDYFGYVVQNNELVRVPLKNARTYNDMVRFDASTKDLEQTWVTYGAYYIEQ